MATLIILLWAGIAMIAAAAILDAIGEDRIERWLRLER